MVNPEITYIQIKLQGLRKFYLLVYAFMYNIIDIYTYIVNINILTSTIKAKEAMNLRYSKVRLWEVLEGRKEREK